MPAEEKASAKKKLICVEGLPNTSKNQYGMSSVNFAFISSPAEGRKQVTQLCMCREYLNDSVRNAMNKSGGTGYSHNSDRSFDSTKMRLIMIHDPKGVDAWRTRLFSGKACLNLLEDVAGWEKSTITTIKHSVYDNAWLVTGPAEWISQPQLLSLATWVLRLAGHNGPLAYDDYDKFEANVLKISKGTSSSSDVDAFAKAFWNRMYVAVKCYKEIFCDMPLDIAWALKSSIEHFGSKSGFYNFCSTLNNVSYTKQATEAQKRFRDYCKEFLPRNAAK